ncbi:Holliday junction resolvase RuvX [Candidatus Kaiserbacteria bacterium]|nr:Holliday junction resolvase RuvX [Candidatus Kaiserbacteria bacterium]
MRYLGIDYGTKHIGVAVSDETGSVAFPHGVVKAGPHALQEVVDIVKAQGVGEIVLGESRNFAGERNPVMEDIEQFKKDIAELTQLPVHYQNELFSSAAAARQFTPTEGSRKQNPIHTDLDASAAALILQSFLDTIKK